MGPGCKLSDWVLFILLTPVAEARAKQPGQFLSRKMHHDRVDHAVLTCRKAIPPTQLVTW